MFFKPSYPISLEFGIRTDVEYVVILATKMGIKITILNVGRHLTTMRIIGILGGSAVIRVKNGKRRFCPAVKHGDALAAATDFSLGLWQIRITTMECFTDKHGFSNIRLVDKSKRLRTICIADMNGS